MRRGFEPWVEKIPWRRKWQSNPVILPGESHGQRSLVGYRPQRRRVRHDWGNLACTHTLNSLHSNPAGRLGGQTPEEGVSQAAHSGDEHRTQPPAWMIHWDSYLLSPHLPFKHCHGWVESLELVSRLESTSYSVCWLFWWKHLSFLLTLASWITGFWVVSSWTWVW